MSQQAKILDLHVAGIHKRTDLVKCLHSMPFFLVIAKTAAQGQRSLITSGDGKKLLTLKQYERQKL